ncbi:MAG: site-specific integrase [Desulfovibrio sp.]
MPTLRKDRGNAWLARVIIDGKTMDTKFFPPGRMKGPEWMAARRWEIERKKEILEAERNNYKILSGLELLFAWGEQYLAYVERNQGRKTFVEKKTVMTHFFAYCQRRGITNLEKITKPAFIQWITEVYEERGPDRANRYRKNLLAAWNWGIDAVEGFPQTPPILERIKPLPVDKQDRYVPPEEDVIKVLQVASGQDLVMLLAFYYTGARRGEIFRLTWADVDLQHGKIRLTDHKGGFGKKRIRWISMHQTLIEALSWWKENRPCNVENVFMRVDQNAALGQPFTARAMLLPVLCKRAGVKQFGFHALRHKAASIAFVSGGLNAAQQLMGHSKATTTDIYIRSAGLYSDQDIIVDALGGNSIGQAANELLKSKMPHDLTHHEAFCNQSLVTKKAL